MKLRAAAVGAALVLLGSASAAGAAPDPADSAAAPARLGAVSGGLASLAPAELQTAGGPAQWGYGAGSSFGQWGGWYFTPPTPSMYPPFGPYPTPQTANFFLSQSLGSSLFGSNNSFGASGLFTNPLAPGASLTLAQLQALGLGAAAGNTFTLAGGTTVPLVPGTTLGSTSLASLLGFPNQFFSPTPFTLGALGLGLSR